MNYSKDRVIDGLMNYADSEIMVKLPTSGKWIMGTALNVVSQKTNQIFDSLQSNPIVSTLDIIDQDGCIDIDTLILAMRSSAERYGNLSVDVPLIGKITFTSSDFDRLRSYIQ